MNSIAKPIMAIRARRRWTLAQGWFVLAGLGYLAVALLAIAVLGWRQPQYDQHRIFYHLLTRPFPDNILQLENGHRPILPNLIRLADLQWFHGQMVLQHVCGVLLGLGALAVLLLVIGREKNWTRTLRAAGWMLSVLALFWLGQGRVLFHSHETVHLFMVLLLSMIAWRLAETAQARRSGGLLWWAVGCGILAGLTHGSGIITLPALILLLLLAGAPWRWLLAPLAGGGVLMGLHFLLPGHDAAASLMRLDPQSFLGDLCRWLSAPWIHAGLGLPAPPNDCLRTGIQITSAGVELTGLLDRIAAPFGPQTFVHWSAFAVGLAGLLVYGVLLLRALFKVRGNECGRLGLTLAGFGLGTGMIIALGRCDYFKKYPEQVYADRYLLMSAFFWLGLSLALLDLWAQHKQNHPVWRRLGLGALLILPLALQPSEAAWLGWAESAFRNSERWGIAVRGGVLPAPESDLWCSDWSPENTRLSLKAMQDHQVGMFWHPAADQMGKVFALPIQTDGAGRYAMTLAPAFSPSATTVWVQGASTGPVSYWTRDYFVMLDDRGRICGQGTFSHRASVRLTGLPWWHWNRRGFDVLWVQAQPGATARVVRVYPDRVALEIGQLVRPGNKTSGTLP